MKHSMKHNEVNTDLKQIKRIEIAAKEASSGFLHLGFSVLFLLLVYLFVSFGTGEINSSTIVVISAVIGGYMALNIGANDVANNVGPAVGSKALTMVGALLIAAVFESLGAFVAGGSVTDTIKKGIIDVSSIDDQKVFILLMFSALLSAALWLNLATYVGAPVSTTHSIVGGVMGSGIAAAGFGVVQWDTMGTIAASWVISPLLGGIIAAMFFAFIMKVILKKEDKLAASQKWVPVLVGIMAAAFTIYLCKKGLKNVWKSEHKDLATLGAGGVMLLVCPLLVRRNITRKIVKLPNKSKSVNTLFTVPLIISAAILSFAHGANDVANAIGPLSAIVDTVENGAINHDKKTSIQFWVMAIGAVGISIGLLLFGPKIIRTVGEKITKLDQVRAFCIALSAALTVIVASHYGLPVSSTHITVGGVFGVGLYREFSGHSTRKKRALQKESEKKLQKRKLVRRKYLLTIAAAWVVTVPCAALLSFCVYKMLNTELLEQFISAAL